jgi:hypothetical protein
MTEHIFTATGLIGCVGAQVLHRWARVSNSHGHGSSQARRHERGTMTLRSVRTDRSPDFLGLGIRLLSYFFGYISTKKPVAQMVARVTVALLALKTFEDI